MNPQTKTARADYVSRHSARSVDGLLIRRGGPTRSSFDAVSQHNTRKPVVRAYSRQLALSQSKKPTPIATAKKPEKSRVNSLKIGSSVLGASETTIDFKSIAAESYVFEQNIDGIDYRDYRKNHQQKRRKKLWLRLVTGFGVLVIMGLGVLGTITYMAASDTLGSKTVVEALEGKKANPSSLHLEGDSRVNVLLLGVGGEGHSGGNLTDTIIVASVDPVSRKSTLLSVPRDLWVANPDSDIPTHKKINSVYVGGMEAASRRNKNLTKSERAAAGFESLDKVFKDVFDIELDYHVVVDFQVFKQAVDAVGGVDIDVPKQLVDTNMAWENGFDPVLVEVGLQTMDGEKALMYARSRYSTSDFDRSERQRQLLVAIKNKVFSLSTFSNPLSIDRLMKSFGASLQTDMSFEVVKKLYGIAKDMTDGAVESLDMISGEAALLKTDRVGDQSVVRPVAGLDQYDDIKRFIKTKLVDGLVVSESAEVMVLSNLPSRSAAVTEELTALGYSASSGTATSVLPSGVQIIDLSVGTKEFTKHYLEKRFKVVSKNTLPADIVVPEGKDFVILVGI